MKRLENTAFARKLRELRFEKGVTNEEVAETLHISKTSYSLYENGRGLPRVPIVKKLAEYYGTDYHELFNLWADSKGL